MRKKDVIATMRRFADLGADIYVTEFTVCLSLAPGSQEERWVFQAGVYREMAEACLESGVCKGSCVWDVTDADSWVGEGTAGGATPQRRAADVHPRLSAQAGLWGAARGAGAIGTGDGRVLCCAPFRR